MQELEANTQTIVRVGPFVDVTDGFTPETGITLGAADEAELLKHGGGASVDISGNTWAAVSGCDGWYDLTLTSGNLDTEGLLTVVVQDDSVCLPVFVHFMVVSQAYHASKYDAKDAGFLDVNIKTVGRADAQETEANNLESACSNYSATRGLSGTALPAAAADAAGGLPISDAGGLDMDSIKSDTAAILTDTAEIAALPDAAAINAEVDTALADINLDHLCAVADADDVVDDSIIAKLASKGGTADWSTFVNTTDALEAIRDNQAGADVAAIADAVWDEAQADHVGAGTFGVLASEIADILTDTAEIGAAGAGLTEAGGDGDHLTAIPTQDANVVQIDGQATNGNNATLNLKQLSIINSAGSAIVAQSTGSNGYGVYITGNGSGEGIRCQGGATGHGLQIVGGATSGDGINLSATDGDGLHAQAGGNNHGMNLEGSGNGEGLSATGGATGYGCEFIGGATSGGGLSCRAATNGHGINIQGLVSGEGINAIGGVTGSGIAATGGTTSGHGIHARAATSGYGMYLQGAGTGDGLVAEGGATGRGIHAQGGATSGAGFYADAQNNNDAGMQLVAHGSGADLFADIVGGITGNVNGNLSGSVGSVTGAVGSVTGDVGGDVVGSVASVTGAVGSVTGDVGGDVVGSVASVVGAVGSVTGNVGGSVASVVGAVGSVTGNVGGSVASVTGAVGSVTGNVGGSVASVTGAVGSVTGDVGGNVVGSVASVVGAVGSVTGAVGSVTGNVGGSVASVVGAVGSVTGAVGSVTGDVGGNVTGSVGSLGTQAKSDVNAQVVDALATDTYAEPGQEAPGATISLSAKIGYLYKFLRNKITNDGSTIKVFADDKTTTDHKATVSESGGTVTRDEFISGA